MEYKNPQNHRVSSDFLRINLLKNLALKHEILRLRKVLQEAMTAKQQKADSYNSSCNVEENSSRNQPANNHQSNRDQLENQNTKRKLETNLSPTAKRFKP